MLDPENSQVLIRRVADGRLWLHPDHPTMGPYVLAVDEQTLKGSDGHYTPEAQADAGAGTSPDA